MDLLALRSIIKNAKRIVFFGGAGVSTDSGIPDFRGSGGLYNEADAYDDPPEWILSEEYLYSYPRKFYAYYRRHMLYPDASPNEAHYILADLERRGKLNAVITQNIDGLHQLAGSRNVLELHGSVLRNHCLICGRNHSLDDILNSEGVPSCETCGGLVRPDVVLYGEGLDMEVFSRAEAAIAEADVMIVGGTSLTVQPAASLVEEFEGEHLILINHTPTPYDHLATHVIRDSLGPTLRQICEG